MEDEGQVPQWFRTAYWIADGIGRTNYTKVKVKQTKRGALGLYAPKNFAYVRIRESGAAIRISSKKEWADKAGVSNSVDYQTENGWWEEPSVGWHIDLDDSNRIKQIVGILSRIMQARHR